MFRSLGAPPSVLSHQVPRPPVHTLGDSFHTVFLNPLSLMSNFEKQRQPHLQGEVLHPSLSILSVGEEDILAQTELRLPAKDGLPSISQASKAGSLSCPTPNSGDQTWHLPSPVPGESAFQPSPTSGGLQDGREGSPAPVQRAVFRRTGSFRAAISICQTRIIT